MLQYSKKIGEYPIQCFWNIRKMLPMKYQAISQINIPKHTSWEYLANSMFLEYFNNEFYHKSTSNLYLLSTTVTTQKMKFAIKDFSSKCDQIRNFLRIWSHLLKKSLMENFIFCAVSNLIYIQISFCGIR